jgi:hypothetical protein
MANIADVAKRLLEHTTSRKLKWEQMEPPDAVAVGTDSKILTFFGTTFNGRHVGVYEERYRAYDVETDAQYWTTRHVMMFFDSGWEVGWEAPLTPGVSRLYDAIKYQKADVDAIMKDILSEDDG